MGRTGGGSSGGGFSSGGGHSFSRSSGGHRVGSSSSGGRTGAGRSSNSSYGGSNLGGITRVVNNYYGGSRYYGGWHRPYRSYGGYNYYRNPVASVLNTIISFIVLAVVMVCIIGLINAGSKPTNTTPRTKLSVGNGFDNNCIMDELGWFDNVNKTSRKLKDFYEETGVQPYILLRADDGEVSTDAEKDAWARDYYENNIPREDAFLYVYFYENGEENSNVPSYMAYVNGIQTTSVMDAEAVSIFWSYLDKYWIMDMSTDEVFAKTFNETADTIMTVSTTGKDIAKWAIILVVVIVVGIILTKVMKMIFKDRREKAKEDERILNTPVEKMKVNTTQDLEDKYL